MLHVTAPSLSLSLSIAFQVTNEELLFTCGKYDILFPSLNNISKVIRYLNCNPVCLALDQVLLFRHMTPNKALYV